MPLFKSGAINLSAKPPIFDKLTIKYASIILNKKDFISSEINRKAKDGCVDICFYDWHYLRAPTLSPQN
jgi:hypothetical protein